MNAISDILFTNVMGTPAWFWLAFGVLVLAILVFDLGILHRKERVITARESFLLYGLYVIIAIAFGAWVWTARGAEAGIEFYTGYVIEQSLSMDNVFVIAAIFAFIGVPRLYQHRVLFWGIIGVIVFRGLMIGAGVALVHAFEWVLFLFGGFLVFTGVKMLSHSDEEYGDLENNPVLRLLRKRFRITKQFHGTHFVVRAPDATGKAVLYLTPLAVALSMIEVVDVIFAVDSVPAIFAVTQDPFIVYTSNIFAILGLRSLYFALSAAMNRFRYLQYAMALVLLLIGIKIFLVPLGIKIDPLHALIVTLSILATGMLYSLWRTRGNRKAAAEEESAPSSSR